MPIIQTSDGVWMQDTRDMIESFETQFPEASVFPQSIELRFLSNLIEAWTDEFWITTAMHYRWRYEENVTFFKKEVTEQLLPFWFVPSLCKDILSDYVANVLISYLPLVGDRPEQYEMIELWTNDILLKLDHHFASYPFLLGDAPTIADFGLAGPIVAHLNRDPHAKEILMEPYRYVAAWADRIQATESNGKALTESTTPIIPATLIPIIHSIFSDFIPMIQATIPLVKELQSLPQFYNQPLPRSLGEIEFPLLNHQYTFKKNAIPFSLWKFQKVLDEYHRDKETVKTFLSNHLNNTIFDEFDEFPSVERVALQIKFKQST